MGLMELLDKVRELRARRQQQPHEDLPDDVTRDKHLRSLRRERRIQGESIEKENLKREIAEFKRQHTREHLWGATGENRPVTHQDFNILSGGSKPAMKRRSGFL